MSVRRADGDRDRRKPLDSAFKPVARLERAVEIRAPSLILILSDINMPGMSGWDFMEKYNELSKDIHDRAVVAMLTTSINPDDLHRAAKVPRVKEFISKPLTPEIFWKVVNENFI